MTEADQIKGLRTLGYSPNESRFLRNVALLSGYFLPRQYRSFRGNMQQRLCDKAIQKRHARYQRLGERRLFHLCGRQVYMALGQRGSPNRVPRDSYALISKLIALDYIMDSTAKEFLMSEEEKVAYFTARGIAADGMPSRAYKNKVGTLHYFPDKFPIRIDRATNRVAFCYVHESQFSGRTFDSWLKDYAPLLRTLGDAEIIYISTIEHQQDAITNVVNRIMSGDSSAPTPQILRYFRTKEGIESGRIGGHPEAQVGLLRDSIAGANHSESEIDMLYARWKSQKAKPLSLTVSCYTARYDYSFLGRAA